MAEKQNFKSKIQRRKTLTFLTPKHKNKITKRENTLDYFENELKVKKKKKSSIKKEDSMNSVNFRYKYHEFCTNSLKSKHTPMPTTI